MIGIFKKISLYKKFWDHKTIYLLKKKLPSGTWTQMIYHNNSKYDLDESKSEHGAQKW